MEVVEITPGVSFESAVSLPNDRQRPVNKSVGRKGSTGNGTRKRARMTLPGKLAAELAKADQDITAANKRILVIDMAQGSRRFVKLSEYASS